MNAMDTWDAWFAMVAPDQHDREYLLRILAVALVRCESGKDVAHSGFEPPEKPFRV